MRSIPHALLLSQLDDALQAQIAEAGFMPAAVRGNVTVPAQGQSPRRTGPALVCRLYPASDQARFAFLREGQKFAEAVVFEDPDDVLAWNLKAGFENALYAASTVLAAEQSGRP